MRTAVAAAALLFTVAAPTARAAEAGGLNVELARMVMPPESYEEILSSVDGQLQETIGTSLQSLAPEAEAEELAPLFAEDLRKMMRKVMPTYEEMVDVQAQLLAKHYTADELKKLRAFYQSPLGQKTIRIMPAVTKDTMTWMQSTLVEKMPPAMQEFQAAVEPKIRDYAKKKNAKK